MKFVSDLNQIRIRFARFLFKSNTNFIRYETNRIPKYASFKETNLDCTGRNVLSICNQIRRNHGWREVFGHVENATDALRITEDIQSSCETLYGKFAKKNVIRDYICPY